MTTESCIKNALPILGNAANTGIFSNATASFAASLAKELHAAAAEDLIDVTPLALAVGTLVSATEFEAQQLGLAATIAQADALLDLMHNGEVPRAAAPVITSQDLVARILKAAGTMRDVFKPNIETARTIRADASELSSLIDGEVRDETRPSEAALLAAQLFDSADRLAANDYGERSAAVEQVMRCGKKLAA